MDTILLAPDAVVLPSAIAIGACVEVAGGRIVALHRDPPADAQALIRIDGTLMPGLIDLQVNGAGGRSVHECTDQALHTIAKMCADGGAAAFLPTLITAPLPQMCARATWLSQWIRRADPDHCLPLGIHLEGPFLQSSGAHDPHLFLPPTDEHIDALLDAADGCLRLVTMAHSAPGAAKAIARLTAAGVTVALGHCAEEQGFEDCVAAGATLVTHLYNAMGPIHHRAPGVSGLALEEPRLHCSLIVDGHHVHPAIVRQAYRLLGPDRLILVTDGTAASGSGDGDFKLSGMPVRARGGVVRDASGHLAGSALLLKDAVANLQRFVPGIGPFTVARVAARNPAALLGAAAEGMGAIEVGRQARFTVLAKDGGMSVRSFDSLPKDG